MILSPVPYFFDYLHTKIICVCGKIKNDHVVDVTAQREDPARLAMGIQRATWLHHHHQTCADVARESTFFPSHEADAKVSVWGSSALSLPFKLPLELGSPSVSILASLLFSSLCCCCCCCWYAWAASCLFLASSSCLCLSSCAATLSCRSLSSCACTILSPTPGNRLAMKSAKARSTPRMLSRIQPNL